jgi:hypothetical protein
VLVGRSLTNIAIEQWTLDDVLDIVLGQWPRRYALSALALPMVQFHLQSIRTGRQHKGARERLQKALLRLSTDPSNRGRNRAATPEPSIVAPLYDQLLAELQGVKDEYYDKAGQSLFALST